MPTAAHLLGTDALGRDVLARVLVASRLSLVLAVIATAVSVVIGVLLGALPLFVRGRIRRVIVSVIDFAVAFPSLLLCLFLIVIFGTGTQGAVIAVGVSGTPYLARLTYTLVASISGREFIEASRMLGVGRLRLLGRHIVPNIAEPLLLNIALTIGGNLLAFAALSFLGLGVQAPSYDWGLLLNVGLAQIYINPAQALGPAIAVIIAGVAFSLIGEAFSSASRAGAGAGSRLDAVRAAAGGTDRLGTVGREIALRVVNLRVAINTPDGTIEPVRGVSFDVAVGESLGIVGESGSGKSLTSLAIADLLPAQMHVSGGRVIIDGQDPTELSLHDRRRHLRHSLSMVFQDPMSALNPTMRIGRQLSEVVEVEGASRKAGLARAIDRMGAVRLPSPGARARSFAHELSGGMRQRSLIAMSLMASPRVIIADEATTALDVTVQKQILDLLDEVRRDEQVAMVLISHDLGVIAQRSDRVLVMYGGQAVEELPSGALRTAQHPYTRALLASVPEVTPIQDRPFATIPGQPPKPDRLPAGCPFAPRCERADDHCFSTDPPMESVGPRHRVACWHPVLGSPAAIATTAGGSSS